MVAAFLHLDAAGPNNGGLCVYPGSHKLGPQEDVGAKESNFHYVDQVSLYKKTRLYLLQYAVHEVVYFKQIKF